MRFLLIHKSDEATEAGAPPSGAARAGMARLIDDMTRAGVLLVAEGVHPSSSGARLSRSGGRRTVTQGPFARSRDVVAGFALIQVRSRDEALEWAWRVADVVGDVELEVRQVADTWTAGPDGPPGGLPGGLPGG